MIELPKPEWCLHCDVKRATTDLGLRSKCYSDKDRRRPYERGRNWTPERELRLRRLTERASARKPLFD